MKLTRTYKLAICPNFHKMEDIRYTYMRFLQYVNMWCEKLFFNGNKHISTEGMGHLANEAERKARGIIRALTASSKSTGNKINVPIVKQIGCPVWIEVSRDSSFDYYGSVISQWNMGKWRSRIYFPVKSHRKLNESLRNGWILNKVCEVFKDKNGKFYLRVFVQKEVNIAKPNLNLLGCDVGYRNSVSRSDGYIGRNLSKVIARQRDKQASRSRNGIKTKSVKTCVKQILDREAKVAIARCKRLSCGLAVESPKVLANLGKFKLQGWASNYFANRCKTLGQENEVFVWDINPAYTSQTCSKCGHRDKRSRSGISFVCTACGYVANADVNAARNIAAKGTVSLEKNLSDKEPKKILNSEYVIASTNDVLGGELWLQL